VTCAASGLVVGLVCAVLTRYLTPEPVVMPTRRGGAYESPLTISFDWSAGFAILPAAGLLVGLLVGVALHLRGWRLRRE
jgi:hypothetical protein